MPPEDHLHISAGDFNEEDAEEDCLLSLERSHPESSRRNKPSWSRWFLGMVRSKATAKMASVLATAVVAWVVYQKCKQRIGTRKRKTLSYRSASTVPLSLLLTLMDEGRLRKALLGTSRIFFQSVELINNKTHQRWARVDLPSNSMLQKQLFSRLSQMKQVDISTLPESDYTQWLSGILAALPFVYLALVYRMMKNQFGDQDRNKNSFEHRRARDSNRVTFQDVAGLDSVVTEVSEIVDYLRDPDCYHQVGASAPNGVLLHGPPGTGKTLLAQAVAGEASVDCFLACSASDFVELYVGRGAARIRSLFKEVREEALQRFRKRTRQGWRQSMFGSLTSHDDKGTPKCSAILFIDELDALAKTRSTLGSNDEREQTLNQLLTEMDGFQKGDVTVIVMAATNRADVLDPAILRRFDRHMHVGYPDREGREKILQVHARRIALEGTLDWEVLSNETAGCSGAELRNVVNEAALLAVRERSRVSQRQLLKAARKIQDMKSSLRSLSASPGL